MNKAILKRAVKKAIQDTGLYTHVKVWKVEIDDDYDSKWLNIECTAKEKSKKKK